MKTVFMICALLISNALFGMHTDQNAYLNGFKNSAKKISEPSRLFVLTKGKKQVQIEEGKTVFVKVDKYKYNGVLKLVNDSTIQVDTTNILISDIDMISSQKTGKTVGLIFASLPIHFTAFVLIAFGIPEGEIGIAIGGLATAGVGVTGVVLEARRGKRYHAYTLSSGDRTIKRKWSYSIK